MDDIWTNNRPAAPAKSFTLADATKIAESFRKRQEENDSKVFRFDGTLDGFKEELAKQGVKIVTATTPSGVDVSLVGSIFGLEVQAIEGSVYVGSMTALGRLRRQRVMGLTTAKFFENPKRGTP